MLALLLVAEILLGRAETGAPGRVLEVRAGPCRDGSRPLTVQVLVNGSAPDEITATMPDHWSNTSCGLARESDRWIAREERFEMSVAVHDAPLGEGVHGVLVSIEAGFEHVHRSHALFVEVDGVARRVWNDGDSVGPAGSSATPSADGIDFEYSLGWWPEDLDEQPDLWRGERIVWDAGARRAVRSVLFAFATIAGTYQSIAAARADQAAMHSKCRGAQLLVLKTDDLRKLAPGKVALASVATTKAGAQNTLAKLIRCGVRGYVKRAQ
jgi:hypothetical protein